MKKGFLITSLIGTTALASVVAISSIGGTKSLFRALANRGSNNTLSLSNQKISNSTSSYSNEQTSTIYTSNNNALTFKCSNVINNASGWQTILPGGYFYNPLTNSSTHNKITGVESVRFNSNGSNTLSLCYGYTLDNSNIIYSYEKTLSPNTTYDLEDLNPSYIYIKNNNNSNVDISNFVVNYSCQETEYPKQNLKVLMIGNSFADDTVYFSQRVAASYGINLTIYDAYIAGCTIDTHYSNLTNDTAAYSMRTVVGENWQYQDSKTLTQIINSNTWDIITFQQASAQIGRSGTYSNLSNLKNAVSSLVPNNPEYCWYQTWAYDSDYHEYNDYFSYFGNNSMTMYNAINTRYIQDVAPLGLFSKLISAGTAVQNLRTSYMKETFSRDGKHMSLTHGRYLLALNFISQVYDIDLYKSPCSYKPLGVRDTFKTVAYESIKNAVKTPLNCTNSAYSVRELEGYNLSNYYEIDGELVGCSYWDSTDASNYNKRISNNSGVSNRYVSTKRFTSSTLPTNSLVIIDEAFGVCPEAWTSDAQQSTNQTDVYQNVIEIDSSFWSGYQYRAFNIFKVGKQPLADSYVDEQYDEIFDGFHIYVPNSYVLSITAKSENSYYLTDKNTFQSNLLNIDSFQRVQLDPIAGFYNCSSNYYLMNSYTGDTPKKFVCSRPFFTANGDLPANTVIVVDSGYQWRSDAWKEQGTNSNRPGNVTTNLKKLDSSFMSPFRTRTINVSKTDGTTLVGQNYRSFMDHVRIYVPTTNDIKLKVPDGTYRGSATVLSNNFDIVLSFGRASIGRVGVMLSNKDAEATGYSYNKSTHQVSISTTGSYSSMTYGTITGTYDETNDRITNISCSGGISSYVSNNGSITCTKAVTSTNTYYDECEDSTAELQARYKRRYMSGSWQVDSSNTDRITSNTTEFVSGWGSLKRRGYSSGAVALALQNDFSSTKKVENIHFWVYNPSSSDITIRMWYYEGTNFGDNGETGSVTAKANQWTYVAMGFGQRNIYNFQIADFTNSGAYLSFDNIYLF